ncbi:hypothetical protein K525DRAFT_186339 [Schizophyllum commune Loenen D]|nr:hypothetical protein K525DRAFT_186339 [Schizophyllum commune Loenen D]
MLAIPHRRTPSPTTLLRIIGRLDVHGGGHDRYHPDARTTSTGTIRSRSCTIRPASTPRRAPTIKRAPTTRCRPHTIARPSLLARAIPHAPIALAALFHTRTDTLIYVRVDAADVALPASELVVAVAEEGASVIASKGAHTRRAAIPPYSADALSSHAGGPRALRASIDPQVEAIAAGRGESLRQRPRFASDWLLEPRQCECPTLREAIPLVVIRRWTLLLDYGLRYASHSSPWPELGRFPRV